MGRTWREASGDQGLQALLHSRLAVAVSSYFNLNNHPSSVYVKTADLTICAAAQARKMTSVGSTVGLTQTCVDPGRPKSLKKGPGLVSIARGGREM